MGTRPINMNLQDQILLDKLESDLAIEDQVYKDLEEMLINFRKQEATDNQLIMQFVAANSWLISGARIRSITSQIGQIMAKYNVT